MIICKALIGKNIYVVGLGRTGTGAVNSLVKSKANVFAWDDQLSTQKKFQESNPGIKLSPPSTINWETLDFIVLSPGIPTLEGKEHEVIRHAKHHDVMIISDIDLLYKSQPEARYIAITGTNGKSTTTSLIGHVLKANNVKSQVGGNIGVSVLELESLSKGGVYVIETSSQQLHLNKFAKFDIALLLNISPDHIDYHGSIDKYISAKENIFRNQTEVDKAIISIDYPETRKIAEKIHNSIQISIHQHTNIHMQSRILYDEINKLEFDFNDYKFLPGQHNEENIAFAYAACISVGLKPLEVVDAIKTYKGLEHRIEIIGELNGVKFVNDSKATNADATEKALKCFDNIYWILGGISKEGGIDALQPYFSKINHAYIIGECAEEFAETFNNNKMLNYTITDTLENAIIEIKKINPTNGVILLSPVSASWDQFKNFEERGQVFKNLVNKFFLNK